MTDTFTDTERNLMRTTYRAAARYENRYGEFKTYIECEDVVSDEMHDALGRNADSFDGELFWELVSFVAGRYYGGTPINELFD